MSKQQISKQTHHFFLTFCLAVPLFSHVHIPRSLHCYSLPVHQMPCDFSTCYCHLTDSDSSHSLPPRTDPSPSHPSHLPDLPRPPAHLFPLSPTSPAVLTHPFSLTRR